MGLHRQTGAASPQSVHSSGPASPGLQNPEYGTGPARAARRVSTVQSRAPARGHLLPSRPPSGVSHGQVWHPRTGGPGTADRAAELEIKARATGRAASGQDGAVPGTWALIRARDPGQAMVGNTARTRKDSENSAPAGKADASEPRRVAQPGTDTRYTRPGAGRALTRQPRQSANLN